MTTDKIGSEPAFPHYETHANGYRPGLTKREWLAGLAMQGMCAGPKREYTKNQCAKEAVALADAMLLEGAK
jgi:hypothetical protein